MSSLTKTHKMDNIMAWASYMHVSLFIKKFERNKHMHVSLFIKKVLKK